MWVRDGLLRLLRVLQERSNYLPWDPPSRRGLRQLSLDSLHQYAAPLRLRYYRDGFGTRFVSRVGPAWQRRLGLDDASAVRTRRIEIGSFARPTPGYIHVDPARSARHVEAYAVAWDLPFNDNFAEEIRAVHVLEHIPPAQLVPSLSEWRRVLAPGGFVQVHVPNGPQLIDAYLSGTRQVKLQAMSVLLGTESPPEMTGPEDMPYPADHKCIFDIDTLRDVFARAGFDRVDDVTGIESDVHTEAWQHLVSNLSLIVRAVK